MTRSAGRFVSLPTLLAALVLTGCAATPHREREAAEQRWNMARAQVKARLASDQLAAGNVSSASAELNEASRLVPDNPGLAPLRARILLAEGRIAEAADLLANTLLEGRAQAEIEYLRGVVLQQQERWEQAASAYELAAETDPAEIAYLVAAVQTRLQLGQPDVALALLRAQEGRCGWTSAYQAALAECHEQRGDWPAAVSAWRRVASAPAAEADMRERLATALFRAGRHADAIPLLGELAAGADTESAPRLLVMLAESCLAQGRLADAQRHAQRALQLAPRYTPAMHLLARALAALGNYEHAARIARQAVGQDAYDLRALELATALTWRAGEDARAALLAQRLAELEPGNPVAAHILAQRSPPTGGAG